ncbi:MAG: winged helix-turn-helix transcriptional regulator [bacterium]
MDTQPFTIALSLQGNVHLLPQVAESLPEGLRRAFASLVLFKRGFDAKRFFDLDDYYDQDRPAYYQALQSVNPKTRDLTQWLEYFAEGVMVQVEAVRKRILTINTDIQKTKRAGQVALDEKQMKIVEFIHENGKVTNRDLQKMFSVSHKTAAGYLSQMLKMNVLKREGDGRAVFYRLS